MLVTSPKSPCNMCVTGAACPGTRVGWKFAQRGWLLQIQVPVLNLALARIPSRRACVVTLADDLGVAILAIATTVGGAVPRRRLHLPGVQPLPPTGQTRWSPAALAGCWLMAARC